MNADLSLKNPILSVLNSNLDDLIELSSSTSKWPITITLYHSALVSYLKSDISALEEISLRVSNLIENPIVNMIEVLDADQKNELSGIQALIKARLIIRKREDEKMLFTSELLSKVEFENPLWQAELAFVKGLLYSYQHDYKNQKQSFLESYSLFKNCEAMTIALLAYQNVLASEASLHPEKRLTVEYYHLMNLALKHEIYNTAGLCALNISREYQLVSANLSALRLSNLAVEYLRQDIGTQHYGLALCHRAQLLFEMNRLAEAKVDLEETYLFDFIEVHHARQFVEKLINNDSRPTLENKMVSAWLRRKTKSELGGNLNFGVAEEKLLELLSEGPKDKSTLLESIFSEEIQNLDYDVLINRFKNLLSRIRKKAPELIQFDGVKYYISQTSLQLENRFHRN